MTTKDIAIAFADLCKAGKLDEAGHRFWSDDIVSIEAMEGPMARVEGRAAVDAKSAWWCANHTQHAVTTEGPYVNGDQFALRFAMDITPKDTGQRTSHTEIALYTVRDEKVVEERFFY